MAKKDIRQYSLNELEAMTARGDYVPTRTDAPAIDPDEGFWSRAQVVMPESKDRITMRIDHDVLEWFKAQGPGYQTRMNAILRSYMEAYQHKP